MLNGKKCFYKKNMITFEANDHVTLSCKYSLLNILRAFSTIIQTSSFMFNGKNSFHKKIGVRLKQMIIFLCHANNFC